MLFGDPLFEILLFNVAQLGFEQALIPFDVLLMGLGAAGQQPASGKCAVD